MERIISIRLFDRSYTFRADAQVSQAEKVANCVVEQVERARASADGPSKMDTVILAALNIANDYLEMKHSREKILKDIDRRCKVLIQHIDAIA